MGPSFKPSSIAELEMDPCVHSCVVFGFLYRGGISMVCAVAAAWAMPVLPSTCLDVIHMLPRSPSTIQYSSHRAFRLRILYVLYCRSYRYSENLLLFFLCDMRFWNGSTTTINVSVNQRFLSG